MAKQIITASTDTASGLGYFLTKLWAKIKATFYTKTETDTKLDSKQATISGGASTITSSNLTASRALISNSSGKVAVSDVTSTELGYLDGVTSNVQTQLNAKAASSDLSKYLPLAGGTITGNIKIDNPCINIGGGYNSGHGSSSTKIFKFFSITLDSSTWQQNAIYDLTYAGKRGCKCYGHLICKTTQGVAGAVANANVYLYNYGIIGTFNAFYYVRSSDTVVDFYYSANDYSDLDILDVKCSSGNNKGTFSKTTVSSLPTGYVQASLISFGASSGSKGSSTQPIYINSSSQPTTCSTYAGGTEVTLNGTNKGASTASFYAPASAGTSGQILKSSGGEPSWADADYEPKGTTLAITSDTTLADANVKFVSVTNCTLTLDASQATVGRVLYVLGKTSSSSVNYKIYASASAYMTVKVPIYKMAVFVAYDGNWYSSI
jgi:hypothetical protein